MNTRIVSALLVLASTLVLFAQAERVKSKAKDLKRNIEAGQTNKAGGVTNTPAKK
jgi:hypothetical protein